MRPWQFAVGGLVAALTACGGGGAAEVLEGTTELDVSICDPSGGPLSLDITNPYLPMPPGHQVVLEGPDGSGTGRVQITVLDDVKVVAGVETRVVEEREWLDDQLTEVSRNYFAQASDGTVCYFGEEVDGRALREAEGAGFIDRRTSGAASLPRWPGSRFTSRRARPTPSSVSPAPAKPP